MTQEDYIKTHPEQFKDDIDKWLFLEFGIIGGCCSAEKSHEYHIARMVAEKLNDAFIKKACEWLDNELCCYIKAQDFTIDHARLNKDLRKHLEDEIWTQRITHSK